jgi:hypothetical protein
LGGIPLGVTTGSISTLSITTSALPIFVTLASLSLTITTLGVTTLGGIPLAFATRSISTLVRLTLIFAGRFLT